eukprot:TRINITY_DN11896_c0_g1_i1.p1 TRINITY_DN11896_c0_g1~~TRINITY_DN11896_c0_g1_i1.p1  ORF type:complete len:579 (-),score=79.51 TRINITY_DN11896_c0_g1_i1:79-1815(-)
MQLHVAFSTVLSAKPRLAGPSSVTPSRSPVNSDSAISTLPKLNKLRRGTSILGNFQTLPSARRRPPQKVTSKLKITRTSETSSISKPLLEADEDAPALPAPEDNPYGQSLPRRPKYARGEPQPGSARLSRSGSARADCSEPRPPSTFVGDAAEAATRAARIAAEAAGAALAASKWPRTDASAQSDLRQTTEAAVSTAAETSSGSAQPRQVSLPQVSLPSSAGFALSSDTLVSKHTTTTTSPAQPPRPASFASHSASFARNFTEPSHASSQPVPKSAINVPAFQTARQPTMQSSQDLAFIDKGFSWRSAPCTISSPFEAFSSATAPSKRHELRLDASVERSGYVENGVLYRPTLQGPRLVGDPVVLARRIAAGIDAAAVLDVGEVDLRLSVRHNGKYLQQLQEFVHALDLELANENRSYDTTQLSAGRLPMDSELPALPLEPRSKRYLQPAEHHALFAAAEEVVHAVNAQPRVMPIDEFLDEERPSHSVECEAVPIVDFSDSVATDRSADVLVHSNDVAGGASLENRPTPRHIISPPPPSLGYRAAMEAGTARPLPRRKFVLGVQSSVCLLPPETQLGQ